jgi:hypothetical protein
MTETRNPLPAEGRETDPFTDIPAADPAGIEVRQRAFAKPEKTVGLFGKPKKRKVNLNPMQQRWFEREGYVFARVEVVNTFGGVMKDLWGIADYLCAHPKRREILLVQTTTDINANARIRKAQKAPELASWLAAGGKFQVHSWSQPGGPGSRWKMRIREVETAQC